MDAERCSALPAQRCESVLRASECGVGVAFGGMILRYHLFIWSCSLYNVARQEHATELFCMYEPTWKGPNHSRVLDAKLHIPPPEHESINLA
jgi:hypothetical protein